MEDLYEELAPIEFSEAERRCAAVMCLVNNSGDITNREIQNATGIAMKTIQRTRKTLEETKDPRGTIERKERPEKSTRRKRSNEFIEQVQDIVEGDPSRSIRSACGSTPTSISTSWSLWCSPGYAGLLKPPLGLATGLSTLPCVPQGHGVD